MKYSELKSILANKEITIADFCKQLQFTRQGLQKSLDTGMFPSNKVIAACQILKITPNEFMGWQTNSGSSVMATNIGGSNQQNSNETISAFREQLKEKDKQINRLLAIIEKWKKQ